MTSAGISSISDMEAATRRLLDFSLPEFDAALLDSIVSAAYDPRSPMRAAANTCLMTLREHPDLWTRADGILEKCCNSQARFFGLQILDDAIKTR
jgi:hypothetical protein